MTWSTVALSHMYHQIEEVCIKSILTAENTLCGLSEGAARVFVR